MIKVWCLLALLVLGLVPLISAQAEDYFVDSYGQRYDEAEESSADYSSDGSDDEDFSLTDIGQFSGDGPEMPIMRTHCEKLVAKLRGSGQLGVFIPRCTMTGEYEAQQCHENGCWCVNFKGQSIPGTMTTQPWSPQCDKVDRARNYPQPVDGNEVYGKPPQPTPTDDFIQPEVANPDNKETSKSAEVDIGTMKPVDEDTAEDKHHDGKKEHLSGNSILRQPLMLAGLIAIAVVCLLCAVLLVMFIVYRMRKKDEGSYALDEPKRSPSHPYTKAPTREYFA